MGTLRTSEENVGLDQAKKHPQPRASGSGAHRMPVGAPRPRGGVCPLPCWFSRCSGPALVLWALRAPLVMGWLEKDPGFQGQSDFRTVLGTPGRSLIAQALPAAVGEGGASLPCQFCFQRWVAELPEAAKISN